MPHLVSYYRLKKKKPKKVPESLQKSPSIHLDIIKKSPPWESDKTPVNNCKELNQESSVKPFLFSLVYQLYQLYLTGWNLRRVLAFTCSSLVTYQASLCELIYFVTTKCGIFLIYSPIYCSTCFFDIRLV